MADGNNEPSHNSEALLSDLNEAANHVESMPQTCGPSPTVKAASLRLTRAHRRLPRKGSHSKEKPEETPTSRPQTRPCPRRQQPPKRPTAARRNRAAAITKPAAISTATQTDEFLSQSPPRDEESSGASSSSPTTSSSSSSWEHETPATSPSSESESDASIQQPEQGTSSAAAAGTNPARNPSVQPQTGFLSQPDHPSPDVTGALRVVHRPQPFPEARASVGQLLVFPRPPLRPTITSLSRRVPPKELSRPLREEVPLPTTSGVFPSPPGGLCKLSFCSHHRGPGQENSVRADRLLPATDKRE
ncbi:hypothetical protein MRX96_046857 [Rhipicephalus microplus]